MSLEIGRSGGVGESRAAVLASISVFDRLDAAERDWRALLEIATVSPYQTYEMQTAWFDTIGRALGMEPYIVVARDAAAKPVALLPLAISSFGPLRVARFIGNRENNFSLGLFAPGAYDRDSARRLLKDAGRRTARPPDLYYLGNAPRRFDGVDNPLAFPDARDSASFGYGVTLPASQDDLAARLSKDARKKLRKKEARLAEMGALTYEHGMSGARAHAALDALIAQKSARFVEMGVIPLERQPGMRNFLERVMDCGALELHTLALDGRVIATYAGFAWRGRFSAMLNSFDMNENIARSSPGDLLLHALMRNLVSRGFTRFDLGAGEARYKQAVCDETIELCDAVVPVSARGALIAPLLARALLLKRRLKQSQTFSRAFARLRQLTS